MFETLRVAILGPEAKRDDDPWFTFHIVSAQEETEYLIPWDHDELMETEAAS